MPHVDPRTDAQLLEEFSGGGSQTAFVALVKRHGPMVHAVAIRVLSNHHDAEDVTQATFLVLAREAGKLSRQPSVAGWLHTVARRLSLDARKSRENRQRREQAAMNESIKLTPEATLSAGFRREVDAALASLPDRYRQPLVLFHLEGASLDEVARRLDLNPSTLRSRLCHARDKLRQILVRRGIEVTSVGLLGSLFAAEAKAAVFSPALLASVLDSATSGGAAVSPHILQLAGRAAARTTLIHPFLTTIPLLMKTKAILISAIVLLLAAIGTTVHHVRQGDGEARHETRGNDRSNLTDTTSPLGERVRSRETPFQSLEEAEQALWGFDMTPIERGNRKEAERCIYRYRNLVARRIPEAYYGELTTRLGEGANNDLGRYFRQMGLYQEWGRMNAKAALASLSVITDKHLHSKALNNVFVGATESNPQAAMKLAETLDIETPGDSVEIDRVDLMDTIFDVWIKTDPYSAVEWAKQAAVPNMRRDQWIADGLRVWTEKDPDAAEKWRREAGFEGFDVGAKPGPEERREGKNRE